MSASFRKYSRHWLVHAIIVAVAIVIGVIIALSARPTRGEAPPLQGTGRPAAGSLHEPALRL